MKKKFSCCTLTKSANRRSDLFCGPKKVSARVTAYPEANFFSNRFAGEFLGPRTRENLSKNSASDGVPQRTSFTSISQMFEVVL